MYLILSTWLVYYICPNVQVLHRGILELDLSECAVTVDGMLLVAALCPMLKTIDLGTSSGCRNMLTSRGTPLHCNACTELDVWFFSLLQLFHAL